MVSQDWAKNSGELVLTPGEIHVWRAVLDCSHSILLQYAATLADDEKARAARFFFERDHNRFVAARGILRHLLGGYLRCSPSDLQFAYHPRGKPFLVKLATNRSIEFNIAHSRNLALLAFSCGYSLGVDVEFVRSDIAAEEIAERYFCPQEVAELRALRPSARPEGFFLGWTRKEAYIKAVGDGLHIPLTSFRVSLTASQPAILESADKSRWSIKSLSPAPEYAGALVAEGSEGRDWQVRCWDWKGTSNFEKS
jgi:4'-phosphopantetheinyl transferase